MTPSEFRSKFPSGEFDDTTALPDETVQDYLDLATPYFNVSRWGNWYSEGLANHVAHRIVVDQARKARGLKVDTGAVTGKTVGRVSIQYDGALLMKQAKDTWLTTDYGRRYAELRDLVGKGGCTSP